MKCIVREQLVVSSFKTSIIIQIVCPWLQLVWQIMMKNLDLSRWLWDADGIDRLILRGTFEKKTPVMIF